MDVRSYVLHAVHKEWSSSQTARNSVRRLIAIASDPLSPTSIAWTTARLRTEHSVSAAAVLELQERFAAGLCPSGEQFPVWIHEGRLVNTLATTELGQPAPILTLNFARAFHWLDVQSRAELLYALAGMKVSRLTLTIKEAGRLQRLLRIPLACAAHVVKAQEDTAVGGFSHLAERQTIPPERLLVLDASSHVDVYVARDWRAAVLCWALDETNRGGELLGVPSCCRDWFRRNWDTCREEYAGDLAFCCLMPLLQKDELEIPAMINPYSVYIGGSLLSHFPCNINCEASRIVADQRKRLLAIFAPELLEVILGRHNQELWISRSRELSIVPPAHPQNGWCHIKPIA